jgi:hypothetical protein
LTNLILVFGSVRLQRMASAEMPDPAETSLPSGTEPSP